MNRTAFGMALTLAQVALIQPLAGQERGTEVRGRIVEAESGRVLEGVLVAIEGTTLRATTDASGRYRIARVAPGPRVVVARLLGYAPARIPITVPANDTLTVDAVLARAALQLPNIIVTADPTGRATGELGTATVIDRNAIDNQVATSLTGVLELMPGVPLSPPGLDGVQQFAIRSAPTGGIGSLTAGGPSAGDLASLGTLIILDGVPFSNNANLQATGPRGELQRSVESSAGGGADLRRIPASTIERVEVIRGIPSARFGDLTQGVIVVETRAGSVEPRLTARLDDRTAGGSGVFGVSLARRGALTGHADVTRTKLSPGQTDDDAFRFSSQLAHRLLVGGPMADEPGVLVLDSRVDAFAVVQNRPERAELFAGQTSWNRDRGVRVSNRLSARFANDAHIRVVTSVDYQRQRSFAQEPRIRGATPFAGRLDEGRSAGRYVLGEYLAAVHLDGDVWSVYTRVEGGVSSRLGGVPHQLLGGLELRREWNTGAGYDFDVEFPPQVTFTGVQGFDRPHRFDQIPPHTTTAIYLDDRVAGTLGPVAASVQAGIRLDLLHGGSSWFSGARDAVLQPRLNLELAPRTWFRLRGGVGRTAKSPTLGQLHPGPQYFDVINLNWFAPDPAEQVAILTTFIRDPANPDIGFSTGLKREVGFELGGGRGGTSLGVVYFHDRTDGGVGFDRRLGFLVRDLYDLADSTIGTGTPPPVIEPPTRADTVPIVLDVPANILTLDNRGVEVTVTLPTVRSLGLTVQMQGALVRSDFQNDAPDFGGLFSTFQTQGNIARSPYWSALRQTADRAIMTWRMVQHQPALGLVITAVVQHIARDVTESLAATDTLAFDGYVTRNGTLVPVPLERRGDPEFADLRVRRAGAVSDSTVRPPDWIASLQVRKTLPAGGQLSFYAFNVFDRVGRGRVFPAIRFGIELGMPLAGLLGSPGAP